MHKNTDQNIQTAPRWARFRVVGQAREVFAKGLRLLLTAALLAVLLNVGVLPVPVVQAATFVVDRTDDNAAATACTAAPNDCSLRGAITAANNAAGADTITLPAGTYTLAIATTNEDNNLDGDLDILPAGGDLTINGAGAPSTIIDGNNNDRVLHIDPNLVGGLTVNISGVTIQNGQAFGGGGILNNGTVNIANSTLSGNQVTGGATGGGIRNTGIANITNSTLSGNQIGGGAGGWGGGIYNTGTANITNSTISGNQVGRGAGGIYNSGTTNLNNVTITGNTADNDGNNNGDGGGIYHGGGTVNLKNTIIAKNFDNSAGTKHPDCSGTLTSHNYNLVGNDTGCGATVWQGKDQVGTGLIPIDPLLGPLADNGGDTFTHALLTGSPAINKCNCTDIGGTTITTDQRGVTRPQGAVCDIGAYEAAPDLSIDKTVTPTTDVTYHGVVTYSVVLSNSGVIDANDTLLTDTLPSEVDFASWVEQPAGANVANDQITWNGTVSASTARTFAFVVNHVGGYGDVVTNTAEYSHTTTTGSDDATFTVGVPDLSINKTVTPTTDVTYHGVVTYTVVLNNNSVNDASGTVLTDTLPVEVDFASWVIQPAGANVVSDQLTWNGTVSASKAITFTFVVTHTGNYDDVVTNTAEYSHTTGGGSADATFTIIPASYLPVIFRDTQL